MSTIERAGGTKLEILLSHTFVIIPVLNERESLPLVLQGLPKVREVIVVDNGSTDGSDSVAQELGATVISEPEKGYGSACLAGMAYVRNVLKAGTANPENCLVAFVDGDFSDHPEQLIDLLQPLLEDRADFVIGSRLLGKRERGAMLPQAYFGNKLACFLMRVLFGAKYTDLGPFRVVRWCELERIGMVDRNFGWTIEMQIKARKLRLRTVEIPVDYRCRIGTSKISGTVLGSVKAGYKIIFTIFKYWWSSPKIEPASAGGVGNHGQ